VSAWKHLRAIALLPGIVTLVLPALIVNSTDSLNVGAGLDGAPAALPVLLGSALIVAGFLLWLQTVRLFARIGRGTLAPWDPTERLVVEGPYRRVRNPMISAVLAVLVGEAILLGSLPLAVWFVLFFAINAVYMPLSEEPGLERRFGDDYREYKRNVPAWLPRLRPWKPER
jgi:protein-S-isoprenylcysteine O-methyltransferase Ste14